jgi:hypothetical protein
MSNDTQKLEGFWAGRRATIRITLNSIKRFWRPIAERAFAQRVKGLRQVRAQRPELDNENDILGWLNAIEMVMIRNMAKLNKTTAQDGEEVSIQGHSVPMYMLAIIQLMFEMKREYLSDQRPFGYVTLGDRWTALETAKEQMRPDFEKEVQRASQMQGLPANQLHRRLIILSAAEEAMAQTLLKAMAGWNSRYAAFQEITTMMARDIYLDAALLLTAEAKEDLFIDK